MGYLKTEQETVLTYDPIAKKWHAWSSFPPQIQKMERKGWKKVRASEENGRVIDACFEAPKNAVTLRDVTKPAHPPKNAFLPKERRRTLGEEERPV